MLFKRLPEEDEMDAPVVVGVPRVRSACMIDTSAELYDRGPDLYVQHRDLRNRIR